MKAGWFSGLFLAVSLASVSAQQLGAKFGDPGEYLEIPLASAKMRGVLPEKVDLSKHFPRPGDQGRQNSCVGWAVAYSLKGYLEKRERKWPGTTTNQLFSPAYIYNQINDGVDEGSNIMRALDLMMREGVSTLADFPYSDRDYTSQPTARVKDRAKPFAIASFRRLPTTWRNAEADTVGQARNHLADGFPIVIGMLVGKPFIAHRGPRGSENYVGPQNSDKEGGHAMCVVGYDDSRNAFKLINSWGTDWGTNGYGWVSYETFKRKVREAYVVQDVIVYRPEPNTPTVDPVTPPKDDFDLPTRVKPWIFADSGQRKLKPSELRVRSAEQLWRARNEIYARHGYIFSSARGKAYTQLLGNHYSPRTGDSDAIEREFNSFENYNIALIKSFEHSRPNPISPVSRDRWVFPDSSARRLSASEVQGLTKEQLWRARNEIFARNGYIFQSDKGKRFAESMGPLYTPVTTDMTRVYENFNSVEEYNVQLIKRFE